MRTIKFRGKRIDGKGFAYGDLLTGCGYEKGRYFILPHLDFYPSDCSSLDGYEITPDTVGQFTGLTDKNGKEIYEGDVLELKLNYKEIKGIDIECNNIFYICFEDSEWKCKYLHGGSLNLSFLAEMLKPEIIGNIHDNPELINNNQQQQPL